MLARDEALELARRAVEECRADGAQAALLASRLGRTRYAENVVLAPELEEAETLYLRARVGNREAYGSTTRLEEDAIRELARAVSDAARAAPEDEALPPLPGPQCYAEVHPLNPATVLWTPDQRAESVRAVIAQARSLGLLASGEHYTVVRQLAVANNAGLEAFEARTEAGLTAVARGDTGGYGYGSGYARDVAQVNPLEVAEQAVSRAALGAHPHAIEPGEYEVVLDQQAVADLLGALARGFGAKAVHGGGSFLSERLGGQVTGPLVSITDDPLSPDGLHGAVDYEGMPRRRVELVVQGVAAGVVHDLRTAHAVGAASTGHARHPEAAARGLGPVPRSLFMGHADEEMETLIGSVRRGLLIGGFAGVRAPEPVKAVLTGLARGAVLIEGGILTLGVRAPRIEHDILEVFRGVELITRERKLVMDEEGSCTVAPAVKLARLRLTAG